MKKRVLAYILMLALTLGLLPNLALAAETVTVSVETKTINGQYLAEPTEMTLEEGDTPITLVTRLAQTQGLAVENSTGASIEKIGEFGNMTHGDESGWMMALNGDRDTDPLPAPRDGDILRAYFTYAAYGLDVDLLDCVEELRETAALAVTKLGENGGNPFFEADGYLEDESSKFNLLSVARGAATAKLEGVDTFADNQAYLDSLSATLDGIETELEVVGELTRILAAAIAAPVEPTPAERLNMALEAVAAKYTQTLPNWWWAVGMSAYERYQPDTPHKVAQQAKQAFLDSIIADVATNSTKSGNLANAILSLRALGYDPTDLTAADGRKYDAVALLKAVDVEKEAQGSWSFFTVPGYVLLACKQGEYGTETLERAAIDFLLAGAEQTGGWSTEWGVDSTGMTMQGLALYYDSEPEVKEALDKAVTVLSQTQSNNGTFRSPYGANAASDAMALLGLVSMGVNPHTDSRFVKEGKSGLDGLLSYYADGGFGGAYYDNQGFASAVAMAELLGGKGEYNLFDFTEKPKAPAVATPDQGSGGGGGGGSPDGPTMNISFTLKTHNATWISKHKAAVPKDGTVGDAFRTVLDKRDGFSYVDNDGYISSITRRGTTMAEFGQGPNSGWKYMVNDTAYATGMDTKALSAGDDLVWYYVTDYTTDTDRDEGSADKPATGPQVSGKGENAVVELKPAAPADKGGQATARLTKKEIKSALAAAQGGGGKALVLAPRVSGTATAVTVELPAASAAAIGKADLPLRVETGLATLTLNPEALADLGGEKDKTVSFTAKEGEEGAVALEIKAGDKTVETLTGGLWVAVPVERATPGTVLMLVDEAGAQTVLQKSVLRDRAMTALLAGTAKVRSVENAKEFADLEQSHWAADAVAFASSRELLRGTETGAFSPETSMTRASLMTILFRLDGAQTEHPPQGQPWYTQAQNWAVGRGLSDGSNPDGEISRQELALLLYRYADGKPGADDPTASDAGGTASWAEAAVGWAVATGILTGDQNGRLKPQAPVSRAEAAIILERFMGVLLG